MRPDLTRTVDFLVEIGLIVEIRRKVTGFLPGVAIEHGILIIDRHTSVANLLHEAGHLACIPGQFRHHASYDLASVETAMDAFRTDTAMLDPDCPLSRAMIQCSDPEATAWAWAAGLRLGLKPRLIIDDEHYDREGAFIRDALAAREYMGINGMQHAGMCQKRGATPYPHMLRWVQPVLEARWWYTEAPCLDETMAA